MLNVHFISIYLHIYYYSTLLNRSINMGQGNTANKLCFLIDGNHASHPD